VAQGHIAHALDADGVVGEREALEMAQLGTDVVGDIVEVAALQLAGFGDDVVVGEQGFSAGQIAALQRRLVAGKHRLHRRFVRVGRRRGGVAEEGQAEQECRKY
jgi:hypothetical protein